MAWVAGWCLDGNSIRQTRNDVVWAHHVVVFVFQNVAVPNVAADVSLESDDNPSHHAGICPRGIFPPGLTRGGWNRISCVAHALAVTVSESVERLPVQDLK